MVLLIRCLRPNRVSALTVGLVAGCILCCGLLTLGGGVVCGRCAGWSLLVLDFSFNKAATCS